MASSGLILARRMLISGSWHRRPCLSSTSCFMSVVDFIKATVGCGLSAFLVYSFPVLSQAMFIALVSLLWLLYARKTFGNLLRR